MKSRFLLTSWLPLLALLLLVPLGVFAQNGEYVLLTGEEGPFGTLTGNTDLPDFLNRLYTLCIGIAVVIAILQIIRGGILWMLTDSVTEKGQASHLITVAILGLVLVLSPVIVFNIINPCILNLSLTGSEKCEGSLSKLTPVVKEEEREPIPTQGNVLVDGEFIKAAEFPESSFTGSLAATQFINQNCSGFERNRTERINGAVLVTCRKSVSFGLYIDFDGANDGDDNVNVTASNATDQEKLEKLRKVECSPLSKYQFAWTGLAQWNIDKFKRAVPGFRGVDPSCKTGEHEFAVSAPPPSDGARVCRVITSDTWCASPRDR